jgi:hypothetical protein
MAMLPFKQAVRLDAVRRYSTAMDGESAGEPLWRTGKRSESGSCIEVATVGDVVLIRSSLNRDTSVAMTRDEWQGFLIAVKDGDFDSI